jgi:DNA-binding FrmR family transcriptional regulator
MSELEKVLKQLDEILEQIAAINKALKEVKND